MSRRPSDCRCLWSVGQHERLVHRVEGCPVHPDVYGEPDDLWPYLEAVEDFDVLLDMGWEPVL